MESILISIKTLLGIVPEYKHFDDQIIAYINSAFITLNGLGVGPETPFTVTSEMDNWSDAFGEKTNTAMVKTYVGQKVRLMFDPPTSSFVLEAMERQIAEMEWRLHSTFNAAQ